MPESMWFFENKYILMLRMVNIQYYLKLMVFIQFNMSCHWLKKTQKYGSTKNKNKL